MDVSSQLEQQDVVPTRDSAHGSANLQSEWIPPQQYREQLVLAVSNDGEKIKVADLKQMLVGPSEYDMLFNKVIAESELDQPLDEFDSIDTI